MNNKNVIFSIILVSVLLIFSICQAADQIPLTPLEGLPGLKKAKEIQKETKKPIILWSTWKIVCPSCTTVSEWFASPEVTTELKEFPRLILASKGRIDEMKESEKMGFSGGYFYIINDYDAKSYTSVWAWEKDTYNMKKDLLKELKSHLKD